MIYFGPNQLYSDVENGAATISPERSAGQIMQLIIKNWNWYLTKETIRVAWWLHTSSCTCWFQFRFLGHYWIPHHICHPIDGMLFSSDGRPCNWRTGCKKTYQKPVENSNVVKLKNGMEGALVGVTARLTTSPVSSITSSCSKPRSLSKSKSPILAAAVPHPMKK